MGGNPFLNFIYQSAIELPAYLVGRVWGKFTNTFKLNQKKSLKFKLQETDWDEDLQLVYHSL